MAEAASAITVVAAEQMIPSRKMPIRMISRTPFNIEEKARIPSLSAGPAEILLTKSRILCNVLHEKTIQQAIVLQNR